MHYSINLSEESDHLLRQLCDPGHNSHSEAISVEDFLSALVEEHLDELFVRRERRRSEKDKKLDGAVRSAKERAKAWSDAAIATQTALEAMRKLVAAEVEDDPTAQDKLKSESVRKHPHYRTFAPNTPHAAAASRLDFMNIIVYPAKSANM